MQLNRLTIGAALLVVLTACTGFPFFGRRAPSSSDCEAIRKAWTEGTQAPPRTLLEVQDIQYDGLHLSGRILVSPEDGRLCLDRRLIPYIHVEVMSVSDCKHGAVASIRVDAIAPRARPEDLLVLEPGFWYGRTVRFWLFDEHLGGGLGPECIEAELYLRSGGRTVARQRIRAERPPVPAAPDGGVPRSGDVPLIDWDELERRAAPDAGTP